MERVRASWKYENSLESATWQKRSVGDLRAKLIASSSSFRLSSCCAAGGRGLDRGEDGRGFEMEGNSVEM
jgi:hypothetical protein